MPPKKAMKGKAKAKGKAKGKAFAKGKAKGKGKAKAKAKGKARAAASGEDPALSGDEAAPAASPKRLTLKRRLQLEIKGGKCAKTVLAERQAIDTELSAKLKELELKRDAAAAKVEEAKKRFQEEQRKVGEAEAKCEEGIAAYKEFRSKSTGSVSAQEQAKREKNDAVKTLAVLEVMAENRRRVQELEEKRANAKKDAEETKRKVEEQKKREKEALEETKRLLAQAKLKKLAEKEKARAAVVPKGVPTAGDLPPPGATEAATQEHAANCSENLD